MSQQQDIVYHLHNLGGITPLDALRAYGVFRLSAIIFDLRNEGYKIRTDMVSNGRKKFAKYTLEGKC